MKKKIYIRIFVAATAFALALFAAAGMLGTGAKTASAGASRSLVVSASSIGENKISSGDFFINGVTAKNGKAIFSPDKTESSLVAKAYIANLKDYGVPVLFSATITLNAKSFADGGEFSAIFGLGSFAAAKGAANTFAITVSEGSGCVKIGAAEYRKEGAATDIYSAREFPSIKLGSDFTVGAEVTTDNNLTFKVNGRTYKEYKLGVDASGFAAFLSSGANEVYLSDTEIYGYRYETPETVDYVETFDDGYNANMFYSHSDASPLAPTNLSVADGKLWFNNTAGAFFSTRYNYSNFELTFDISDLRAEATYEGETLTGLISGWFGIAFGLDSPDVNLDHVIKNGTWLNFEGIPMDVDHSTYYDGARYVVYDKAFDGRSWSSKAEVPMHNGYNGTSFSLWDKDFISERTVSVKFAMNDGLIEVYYRFEGEKEWGEPYFAFDMGSLKTGYVAIIANGETTISKNGIKYNSAAQFKIDNFSVKNTDFEGVKKVIPAPDYKPNRIDKASDYDYTTKTDDGDLIGDKLANGKLTEEKSGCGSGVFGGAISALTALAAAGAAITFIKRRDK